MKDKKTTHVTLPTRIDDLLKELVATCRNWREAEVELTAWQAKYPEKPPSALFITVELDDQRAAWKVQLTQCETACSAAAMAFQNAAHRLASAYDHLSIPF